MADTAQRPTVVYPTYDHIIFEKKDRIGYLTMNRPEKLNALRRSDFFDMLDCVKLVQTDPEVHVLIIRGAGTSFSTGHDLTENSEYWYGTDFAVSYEPLAWERFIHMRQYMWGEWNLFWELPQITIAQVQGHAIAVGLSLAMLCDICVVADDCQLRMDPFLAVGGQFTNMLPLLMGIKKAKEVFMSGRTLNGPEAVELGMANRSVPVAQLSTVTEEVANSIARYPLEVIHFNKLAINKFFEMMGVREAIETTITTHVMATMFDRRQEWARQRSSHGWREAWDFATKLTGGES